MKNKKDDFRLEICDLKINNNETKIYLKGWAHYNEYEIIVKKKNSKKELYRFKGSESKYDVCLYFNEPIEDNKYGFESKNVVFNPLKEIDICLETPEIKKIVFKVRNNPIHNTIQKIKKIFIMIKKAIKLFWNEYHFLVPPSMIKKYFSEFKNRMKTINNENSKCYNQNIIEEYHEWINRYEIAENKKSKMDDIAFVIFGEENKNRDIECKSIYYLNDDVEKILPSVKEKYVCFLTDNCILNNNFSYNIINCLKNEPDFVYSDNDMIIDNERQKPLFKPDWSRDTILGANYIGELFVVKTEIAQKYLNNKIDKNIYAYILETVFKSKKIIHISKILYHVKKYSTNQDNNYCLIESYLKKNKISANLIKNNDKETITVEYKLEQQPLVSIVIPTKDAPETLDICLKSIYEKTTYKNYEIIIVDNNSCADTTFKLFEEYKKNHSNFMVTRMECPFNYSYINNQAVINHSKGEYIVLLNNDTEIITKNWIELMLGYASLDHIGVVGAKLLFDDDTLQHAGLIIGKGGLAGHAHYGEDRYELGNQWELKIPYNVSGNTAACIMISKDKYMEVNGLEEKLQVAFNDVDFNLKIREKGYSNIYLPNVELYHYESKTRGLDTTPEKQKRFMQEWQFMMNKWGDELKYDPYYNDNFSKSNDYKLDASKEVFKND